jgi:hypothetical protein
MFVASFGPTSAMLSHPGKLYFGFTDDKVKVQLHLGTANMHEVQAKS